MISHVEFDLDGTLISTMDSLVELYADIANGYGKQLTQTFIDAIPHFDTKKGPYELMESELGIQLPVEVLHRRFKQFQATCKCSLLPGVERLVRHLHGHRIPMAVATATTGEGYRTIVNQFGDFFPTHFSHAVCGYDDPDVIENKPGPDVYRICADRFVNPPVTDMSQVLIFEDSIVGLTGAIKSGAKTVFIASQQCLQSKLFQDNKQVIEQATLIIDSMEHFCPEVFGLPAFPKENDQNTICSKSENLDKFSDKLKTNNVRQNLAETTLFNNYYKR